MKSYDNIYDIWLELAAILQNGLAMKFRQILFMPVIYRTNWKT